MYSVSCFRSCGFRVGTALLVAVVLVLFAVAPAFAQDGPREDSPRVEVDKDCTLTFYGTARLDLNWSDSLVNDTQVPSFVLSEDPTAANFVGVDQESFTLYPRLTRFGMLFGEPTIPDLGDVKVKGQLELDFYAFDTSDSRDELRMRHAYGKLTWDVFSLLFGQTSDLISPLYPNANHDMILWNAGNLGDRRPQIRPEVTVVAGDFTLVTAMMIGLAGAVTNQDLDGDGQKDGELSALPMLQGRLAGKLTVAEKHTIELGFWAAVFWFEASNAIGTAARTQFDGHVIGVDLNVPIIVKQLWIKGEAFIGENLSDLRGGNGQGVNTTTGQLIHSVGFWAEIGFSVVEWSKIMIGYSRDDPLNHEVAAGGREETEVLYLVSLFTVSNFTIGVEYQYWKTDYVGSGSGEANRFKLWLAFSF